MTRKLGPMDGAALVVASVVGAGIFTVPGYVAALGGTPAVILLLWLAGGLMALAGALSYAELAARLPRGGAEYVYIREAFGPTAGFLSGWTSFVAGFSGAIAAAAMGFAHNLVQLVPSLAPVPIVVVATVLVAAFTALNVAGLRAGQLTTNILTLVIIVGVVVVAGAGLLGDGGPTRAAARPPGWSALSALVPIFFTFSGWNAAAYVAGDFRNPARAVPRALIGGTLAVTVLYLALNASLVRTIRTEALAETAAPVSMAAMATLGGAGGTVVSVLVLAALASSVCAMIITGPRIYKEMAADGALPPVFGRSSSRDGVPVVAAVAQSAWSIVLVLTGTFEQIVTYAGFSIMLFSVAGVLALFVLRRRHGVPAGYRVPGYPLIPLAFVTVAILIAVASLRYAPGPSFAGVLLVASGLLWSPGGVAFLRRARSGFVELRRLGANSLPP